MFRIRVYGKVLRKKASPSYRTLHNFGLGGAMPGIIADVQLWPSKTSRPASAYLSVPSKLPGHTFFRVSKLKGCLAILISFALLFWPVTTSLPLSSLLTCLIVYL